tara:strand:- start:101 stop:793 length:693 start_codon:yes stop_codon:yes gene_type:complete
MDLVILAGGSGTRISAISQGTPKSLLPIGNLLFMDKILSNVNRYDINHIYLSLHYKPEAFNKYLKNCDYNVKITPIIEPVPLGTGGAIHYIIKNTSISDPFFVINGDTLSNTNLDEIKYRFTKTDYDAMIGISNIENSSRYGKVEFEKDELVQFNEKKRASAGWINNGHYILKKDLFKNFSGNFSIEYDLFPSIVEKKKLGVFKVVNDQFIDMGIPDDYKKLCEKYKNID